MANRTKSLRKKKLSKLWLWRTRQGLSLAEVSDLTGVSEAMWCRVESGDRQFAPLTRVQVARRLGVPVSELFDVEELPDIEEASR